VLDSQMAGFNERIGEGRADVVSCRSESAECRAEFERMRTQVSQVMLDNEKLVHEYREHIRNMQTATANCEMAAAEKDTRTALQLQDISQIEAQLHEHRAISEARLNALEKTARNPTPARPSAGFSERRVSELEEELAQAKRQLSDHDDRIRELHMRLQTQTEKAALTRLADRQEVSDLVARAIQDHMRKNPPRSSASYDAPPSVWPAYTPHRVDHSAVAMSSTATTGSPERHGGIFSSVSRASSPLRPASFDRETLPSYGEERLSHGSQYPERASVLLDRGSGSRQLSAPVSRVMEDSQQRVQDMRRASMQR